MTKYHSVADAISQAKPDRPHCRCTLAELYPDEIAFFKKRFVWPSNHGGCYVRYRYEKLERPGAEPIPKWIPVKTRGNWQHLYPALVDSLVEKHLNFEKFWKLQSYRDRLSPSADETAFWFGTMAGERTYNDCIDLDSHEQIGWNPLPTMWHESRTGSVNGPYSWRFVPVVRPSLRFFQIAKVVYDRFPNRIWAFSSANLGLAVWKVYARPALTHVVYRKIEARLRDAGLNVEHYPMPAKTGLGRCHRRPCGMDSGIITDDGLITDSIQQIRAYMRPPRTPTFHTIVQACIDGFLRSYDLFLAEGESLAHKRMPDEEKHFLVESCRATIEVVRVWMRAGCPIDHHLIAEAETEEDVDESEANEPVLVAEDDVDASPSCDQYPEFFWRADLKAVAQSGQWVQFVKFLVETGFPTEDKFSEVVQALALWFCYVELFEKDPDRIKEVLREFVLTRHNDKVSRLIAGQQEDVLSHVDRIVDHVLSKEDSKGQRVFADLRAKRASGKYRQNYDFESQIMQDNERSFSSFGDSSTSYFICGGLSDRGGPAEWHYQPDNSPLPDDVMSQIQEAFRVQGRQLRRNKATGRFPTLDAITRLFNYLFCGRNSGSRRASQHLLRQMGFPKKSSDREAIIRVLTEEGLLFKGGYQRHTLSREWHLHRSVIVAMSQA